MKPQILALITAMAWGIGGFFEKKGLHAGGLSPQVSFPNWKSIPQAGTKSLLLMIIGGGVIAGSVGMLSFYAAIRGASSLAQVMPIAFTSPLFSALMGIVFGGEKLNIQTVVGSALTLVGIVVLTSGGA